jgi:hypothetical protein
MPPRPPPFKEPALRQTDIPAEPPRIPLPALFVPPVGAMPPAELTDVLEPPRGIGERQTDIPPCWEPPDARAPPTSETTVKHVRKPPLESPPRGAWRQGVIPP